SNRINDPFIAEKILRDDRADAVCIGRTLIAEPYLANKAKDGKYWDIRQCVGCNQGCFDHIFKMKPVECMRNYEASREGKFDLSKKSENPKKVLIIGSGPGGLEAARVATYREKRLYWWTSYFIVSTSWATSNQRCS
ncbi:MAG: hypothetical protein ACTSP6_12630, partial [Promethearchaeota archaeon]